MNIKEEIFNTYWNQWGRLYVKERDHQNEVKSFPNKFKWVKVGIGFYYDSGNKCSDIKMHSEMSVNPFVQPLNMEYFKKNNLVEVAYVNDKPERAYIKVPVYRLWANMRFMKKDRGEWDETGWAIGDYYIDRQLTDEEILILQDSNLLSNELNDFFETKYQERLAEREKERIEYEIKRARKRELFEKLHNDTITKNEANILLNLISDNDTLKLINIICS